MKGKVVTVERNGNSQAWRDVSVVNAVDKKTTGEGTGAALAIHMPIVAHTIKEQMERMLLNEEIMSCVYETMNTIKRTCESNVGLDITMSAWVRGGGAIYDTPIRGEYQDGRKVDGANYDDAAADIISTGIMASEKREAAKERVIQDESMSGLFWYAAKHRFVIHECRELKKIVTAGRAGWVKRENQKEGDHMTRRVNVELDASEHETCEHPELVAASNDDRIDARAVLCKVMNVHDVADITPEMISKAAEAVHQARIALSKDCNKLAGIRDTRGVSYRQLAAKIVIGLRDGGQYAMIGYDGGGQRTVYDLTGRSIAELAKTARVTA